MNLLPGPVAIRPDVREALSEMPVSHRSEAFLKTLRNAKELLCQLTGSRQVEIMIGSGTLANDAIAGQLSLTAGRGLILSNGEFGDRLVDHASRFRLSFDVLRSDWGDVFDYERVERVIRQDALVDWLWAVHCETSTGVLNDIGMLKEACAKRSVRLCLDCISSIGTVPVDLGSVYLASCVSGKGLGAFPGLSMVFYNHQIPPAPGALPRYLDLGLYAARDGVPFTHSSNLVSALLRALQRFRSTNRFVETLDLSMWLKGRLRELGYHVVTPDAHASPAVITIALPDPLRSGDLGRQLEDAGYMLSYRSDYLLKRNWIQICLMAEWSRERLVPLLDKLREICAPARRSMA